MRLLSAANKPYSVKELAEQLKVTKSTIERDLATLQHDFAIIDENVGKQKKTYRIDQSIKALETLTFGTSELLALYAAHATLTPFAGTPIHDDLTEVMLKIRGFLSPRHNGGLKALANVFTPHARGFVNYGSQQDTIDDLCDSIARRRRCKLTYHAAWKKTTRTHLARPLRLVWHESALYLFACLGDHERITTLAVQRIHELEKLDETFTPPKLDVDAHVEKAFGIFVSDQEEDVHVVFDPEIAWRIEERTFHPKEKTERDADGRLHYRVRSSAQWEIIPWVQSFGALAELVAPASWRESLRRNVEAMLATYTPAG